MSYDPFTHEVSPQPEASKNGNGRRAAIVVSAVVAVAIVVLGVIGTIWMLNRDEGVPVVAASPSPTPEIDQEALARAEALGFSPVAYEMDIEEISDYYRELQTSLELFEELIPATEEGAEYVYAFMIVITDYKAAGLFGAPFEGEARDEFADIELQFLTVSDMDTNISITQSDGTVFEHDGTAPAPAD